MPADFFEPLDFLAPLDFLPLDFLLLDDFPRVAEEDLRLTADLLLLLRPLDLEPPVFFPPLDFFELPLDFLALEDFPRPDPLLPEPLLFFDELLLLLEEPPLLDLEVLFEPLLERAPPLLEPPPELLRPIDLPAMAPTTPPTIAPTGPAMLPTTAPVAAPAADLEIAGSWMLSDDPLFEPLLFCSAIIVKLSVGLSYETVSYARAKTTVRDSFVQQKGGRRGDRLSKVLVFDYRPPRS